MRQPGYATAGTVDSHIVGGGGQGPLTVRHSWRGFLYAVVSTEGGASFRGGLSDVVASWSAVALEESGTIAFAGDSAPRFEALADLVHRSFLSNLGSGLPTDCPTREKHGGPPCTLVPLKRANPRPSRDAAHPGWLGDAMDAAAGSVYTHFTQPVYRAFLRQVAAAQAGGAGNTSGFVPVVVPVHQGVDAASNDISWTGAFPVLTDTLDLFYGDAAIVRDLLPRLKRWVQAQLRNATALHAPGGLPDFSTYGDLSSLCSNANCPARGATSRAAAAGTFLVAMAAASDLAARHGEPDMAKQWRAELVGLRSSFDRLFWNAKIGAYGADPLTLQTVSPLAIAAKAASPTRGAAALAAVLADVRARNFTLTVGNVGSARLLGALSASSPEGHDAALRMVEGDRFPGWGYWLAHNASTCWESWTTEQDKGDDHYHGSLNHAWLCGGLARWLYADVGGIRPTSPGYATVAIAPKISQTLGPAGVNASVRTVRGTIETSWTRNPRSLRVSVPPAVHRATILFPPPHNPLGPAPRLFESGKPVAADRLVVGPGAYHFEYTHS